MQHVPRLERFEPSILFDCKSVWIDLRSVDMAADLGGKVERIQQYLENDSFVRIG